MYTSIAMWSMRKDIEWNTDERSLLIYGHHTAALHLRHFWKRAVDSCALKKSGKVKCLANHETCRTPQVVCILYQVFKQHFSQQCLQCLMVKAMVKTYCTGDVFQHALRTSSSVSTTTRFPLHFCLCSRQCEETPVGEGNNKLCFTSAPLCA